VYTYENQALVCTKKIWVDATKQKNYSGPYWWGTSDYDLPCWQYALNGIGLTLNILKFDFTRNGAAKPGWGLMLHCYCDHLFLPQCI